MTTTYSGYLRLDELLSLQEGKADPPEHDETLFIIIHQVYELWFKQVLHELDELVTHLNRDELAQGGHQLKRVLKIFKTLVAQLDVLETMTPLEFLSFRSFLDTASGFQSVQFRELEFLLGRKDPKQLDYFEYSERERANLERRLAEPSLWDAVLAYFDREGHTMPTVALERDVTQPVEASEEVQQVLLGIYRNDPRLTVLCESLTDLDEGLQEWRYRHAMMVQRTIGTKQGTGGSPGAAYLRTTLFHPAFPDLWEIRSEF